MVDLRDDLGGVRRLDRERGFTLVEMLAALGILLFGITALLGALSQSVSQRRSTDARLAAAALADEIVHRLQHEALRLRPDAESDLDVEFATLADQEAPNFPGMTWSVTTTRDDDRPDLWLADIKVTWLEEEDTSEEFLRVLPRQLPLAQRVLRFRAETTSR